jgi:hypothetical protein
MAALRRRAEKLSGADGTCSVLATNSGYAVADPLSQRHNTAGGRDRLGKLVGRQFRGVLGLDVGGLQGLLRRVRLRLHEAVTAQLPS